MYLGRLGKLAGAALGLLLLSAGCGGNATGNEANALLSTPQSVAESGMNDEKLLIELTAVLERELAVVGKDISETGTVLPHNNGIAQLRYHDQHLVGEPEGMIFRTTFDIVEDLRGDYDGNGRVNAADMVPLARYWGLNRHDEDYKAEEILGLGNSQSFGRVDGNDDGVINSGDITVIAQHWQEGLDGYRIYLSTDGGAEELLPDLAFPDSEFSVARRLDYPESEISNSDPTVRFSFWPEERPYGTASYQYDVDIPVDRPNSLRVVPVIAGLDAPESGGTVFDIPANQAPVLNYDLKLIGDELPVLLQIDSSDSRSDPGGGFYGLTIKYSLLDDQDRKLVLENKWEPGWLFSYLFTKTGSYRLTITATDEYGAVASSEEELEFSVTSTATDSAWTVGHSGIIGQLQSGTTDSSDLEIVDGNPALLVHNANDGEETGFLYSRALDPAGSSWGAGNVVVD